MVIITITWTEWLGDWTEFKEERWERESNKLKGHMEGVDHDTSFGHIQ
jgi:hypothetical protein